MSISKYLKTNFGSQVICSKEFDFTAGSNKLTVQRQIRKLTDQERFDLGEDLRFLSDLATRVSYDPSAEEKGLEAHSFVGFNALFTKFSSQKLETEQKKPLLTATLNGVQNFVGARTSSEDLLKTIEALRKTLLVDRKSALVPSAGVELPGKDLSGPVGLQLGNNRKLETVAANLEDEITALKQQIGVKVDENEFNKSISELKALQTNHNSIPAGQWLDHKPFIAFFMKCEKLKKEFSRPHYSALKIAPEIEEIESKIRQCRSSATDLKSFALKVLAEVVPFLKAGKDVEQLKKELTAVVNGKTDAKLTVSYFVSNVINRWLEEKTAAVVSRLEDYKRNPHGENLEVLKANLKNLEANKARLEAYLAQKKLHDTQEQRDLTALESQNIKKCSEYFEQISEMLTLLSSANDLEDIKDTAISIKLAMDTPYFNENAKVFVPAAHQKIVNLALPLISILQVAESDPSFELGPFMASIDLKFFDEVAKDPSLQKSTVYEELYADFDKQKTKYAELVRKLNEFKVNFNQSHLNSPENKAFAIKLYVEYLSAVISILNNEAKLNIQYSQTLITEIESVIDPLRKQAGIVLPPPFSPEFTAPVNVTMKPTAAKSLWDKDYLARDPAERYMKDLLSGMERATPEAKQNWFQQIGYIPNVESLKNLVFGNFYWAMRADNKIPESPGTVEFAGVQKSWGEGAFLNKDYVVTGLSQEQMLEYRTKAMDLAMRGIFLDGKNYSNYRVL